MSGVDPSAVHRGGDGVICALRRSTFPRWPNDLGMRVFSLGLVLGLLATLTSSRLLLGAGAFAVLLPWASLATLPGRRIEVTVESPQRARVGLPLPVRVRVRNTGRTVLPPLELRCVRPLFETAEGAIGCLRPGEDVVWEVTAVPLRRGLSSHAHVEVVAPDVFGLSTQRLSVTSIGRVAIGPRPVPVPLPLQRRADDSPLEPGDLRSWRPGDPGSAVAWRASARRSDGPAGTLVVRERVPEQTGLVRIGLTAGPAEELERALEVLAATALGLLDQGQRVALAVGEGQLQPTRGETVLDALAEVGALPLSAPSGCDLVVACRSAVRAANGGSGGAVRWVVDAAGRVEPA